MRSHPARRLRRLTVVGAAAVAASLAIGSVAWACTTPTGTTYFTKGTVSASVNMGARVSAFATGAPQGVGLKLVIGENGDHANHACMITRYVVNDTVRLAGPDGFIPPTAGPAGDAGLPPASYLLCFVDYLGNSVATSAAAITII